MRSGRARGVERETAGHAAELKHLSSRWTSGATNRAANSVACCALPSGWLDPREEPALRRRLVQQEVEEQLGALDRAAGGERLAVRCRLVDESTMSHHRVQSCGREPGAAPIGGGLHFGPAQIARPVQLHVRAYRSAHQSAGVTRHLAGILAAGQQYYNGRLARVRRTRRDGTHRWQRSAGQGL